MTAAPNGDIDPQALEWSEVAAHLIALCGLPGIGPATLLRWHREVGAPTAWRTLLRGRTGEILALAGPRARLGEAAVPELVDAARATDPQRELERHAADGRRVLVEGTPGYPARLRDDPAPPAVLFAQGDPEVLDAPTVAIVGTRNATRAGRDLAAGWGAELAAAGVGVVSGLALGIDAAAHRGALHAASVAEPASQIVGAPVGVVAAGLDVVYPRRHAELHHLVARHGVLVSEVPLGVRPSSWRFPARNRIIAGLADAVVVVESRVVGGSILTAGEALERDVPVLAVPGHPSAPASAGTNDLLFDGAHLVRSTTDVLDHLGLRPPAPLPEAPGALASLDPTARAVLDAVGHQPSALAEVVARCELELEDVSRALVALEAAGRIIRTGGWYEAVASRRPAR
ncbi:MAG: DNA-protecting protein DprA [Actinobacteria bacterium]|nr:DNA-protecting protein DprA [Actinomycetota bacterium]